MKNFHWSNMFYCSTKMDVLICWLVHLVLLSTLPIAILKHHQIKLCMILLIMSNHLEIKRPYSARETTLYEAAQSSGFCCTVNCIGDITLKENHAYYSHVQGQIAIGQWPWCNFVIYTPRHAHIQNIHYNSRYWECILPKLSSFYCLVPEIVSHRHEVGQPVHKLNSWIHSIHLFWYVHLTLHLTHAINDYKTTVICIRSRIFYKIIKVAFHIHISFYQK